jgi:hypothetical protein
MVETHRHWYLKEKILLQRRKKKSKKKNLEAEEES